MWIRVTRRVPVDHPIPRGVTFPAEPWPFPHAAVYDAEAKRFRQCVKVSYGGQDVRLWPEEYEEIAVPPVPPVISTIRFASFDEEEEI